MSVDSKATLCGILVHWHDETRAAELAAAWPEDPRFELLVVDNGSSAELRVGHHRVLQPGRNLGFGGAVNLALEDIQAPIVLILNSDARPEPEALERILEGFAAHEEAVALAPRLLGPDGQSQHLWQLRPLPSPWQLVLQALMLPVWSGPEEEPAEGTPVEQPAAAVLAIRRNSLIEIGGFDEKFYPAWFEDVDLAARLHEAGNQIVYWPRAQFVHELGSSVDRLGYGRFLWIHYRNLLVYLRKHHGAAWSVPTRFLLIPACLIRLVLLPLRKPKRADTRREAASGLSSLAVGALTDWRLPRNYPFPRPKEPGFEEHAL